VSDDIVEKFRRMKQIRAEGTPEQRAELERRALTATKAVLWAEKERERDDD